MYQNGALWIANSLSGEPIYMEPSRANRHGLIAGATGTGKTVTLKVMAESFSDMGVPVFVADIKGDLSGMTMEGADSDNMQERIQYFGIEGWKYQSYPTRFWDVYGKGGHPVRTTVSELGPMLFSRILGLNETQSGILNIAFRVADENGLLLLDLKDLKAMLRYLSENSKELSAEYGNIAPQSVNAITRSIVSLEDQGGETFFGEPAFDVKDWIQSTYDGRGWINVLHCVELFQHPTLYSTFLLWMLSELYEVLPEAGDLKKPKIVFFFDEAHLLFDDAPKVLLQKIEQVVRLVRSKGVGVYFITQNPADVPDSILGQLGNRVQHALRAYTPAEQKKVKAAADTFRPNPAFKTADTIMELATGEALISFLQEDGSPAPVERCRILPPQSFMGGITEEQRLDAMNRDGVGDKYRDPIDRESAYEILAQQAEAALAEQQAIIEAKEAEKEALQQKKLEEKETAAKEKEAAKKKQAVVKKAESLTKRVANSATQSVLSSTVKKSTSKKLGVGQRALNSAFNSAVSGVGREISNSLVRGLFGTFSGKK